MRPVVSACLAVLLVSSAPARTWFVDPGAQGTADGRSWDNSFAHLQDALEIAQAGDEIWVAADRYTPDCGSGDRFASFVLVPGVALYGGFAGWEASIDQRDLNANKTILSGDLNGDDGPRDCAELSSCCRKWESPGCDNAQCQAMVCAIEPDCCDPGEYHFPYLDYPGTYCAFLASAECCELGNARRCENSYLVADARTPAQDPYLLDGLEINGAFITATDERLYLGGMGLALENNSLSMQNCVITENSLYAIFYHDASVSVSGCSIANNRYSGLYGWNSSLSVDSCEFVGNDNAVKSSIDMFLGGHNSISNSIFRGNTSASLDLFGPAIVRNCSFQNNEGYAITTSGPLTLQSSNFSQGGVIAHDSGALIIANCRLSGGGFGVYGGIVDISNSVFVGGRGPHMAGTDLTMTNCAIVGNRGGYTAGLHLREGTNATLRNCILWDNVGGNFKGSERDQVELWGGSQVAFDHSIVQGWTGNFGGEGNSGLDPVFVSQLGLDGLRGTADDDVRLMPGSPAINAGDPNFVPDSGESDLDGHARVLCGQVDIGAYEFGAGDFNCDQTVNLLDFSGWPQCMTDPAETPSPLRSGPHPGPLPRGEGGGSGCEAFDSNVDSDIDLADFAYLQRVLVAP